MRKAYNPGRPKCKLINYLINFQYFSCRVNQFVWHINWYLNLFPAVYSLFINSGGGQTNFNGKRYDADNETSQNFYVSPLQNWACSFSGDFYQVTVNSSDYTKRVPCKISNSDTSLYEEARLSPVSLTYHGFSLRKGRYNVTLHFAEIVYTDDSDYNGLRKRRFDVYIQVRK